MVLRCCSSTAACSPSTSDVVGLLGHLDVSQVDLFGFSVGGAVALRLVIRNPELVRKAILSSVSFDTSGDRPENAGAVGGMKVLPPSQLAVFPGTTHFTGLARTALVLDAVTAFLDAS
ncbi:alpha/beta hydrolase [Kribbella sp. NPDC026611]|uniref:alpha/beta fold hydrolase n=1 Tax=Kribbella sp. NPDC026611 TaxID=3154911 RepID=UPI0034060614